MINVCIYIMCRLLHGGEIARYFQCICSTIVVLPYAIATCTYTYCVHMRSFPNRPKSNDQKNLSG